MAFTALQTLTAAQLNNLDITTLTTSGTVTVGAFTLPATDGSANQVLVTNGSGTVTWQNQSGGGGSPGGSDGQIQYNNGSAFGGASALHYDDSNNRLGIGTTSPDDPLHVVGDVTIEVSDDGSAAQPELTLHRGSSSPADADYLGQIKFSGRNDNSQTVNYAKITGKISDASDTTEDGLIEIANIKAGSQSIGYRFTSTDLKLINSRGLQVDGNVGIGTTSPADPLHVADATSADLRLQDTGGTLGAAMSARMLTVDSAGNIQSIVGNSGTSSGVLLVDNIDGAIIMRTQSADSVVLATNNTTRVTVNSSGNVGIGTTSPTGMLHVSGSDPKIWLTDTDTNADSYVSASSSVGSLILSADENNEVGSSQIALKVDGSDKMVIQSTGNVGIGITAPDNRLHVQLAGTSKAPSSVPTTHMVIADAGDNNDAGVAVYSANTGKGYMRFGDSDASAQAGFSYDHATNELKIRTNGSDRVTIDSSGLVRIQNGSASAPSLTFVSDTNTGIYRQAENEIGFATGGAERFRMGSFGLRGDDSGNVYNVNLFRGNNGSSSAPTFSFDSDTDTGVFLRTTGQVAFTNAGTVSYMTTAGFYLASGDWFRAQGNGGFYFQTHGGGWQMTDSTYVRIYNSKSLYLSNEIFVPNMDGTSSYNTVRFNSSTGQLMRFTSITEIKEDITSIKPMMDYLNERSYLYDLRPVLYHEKDKADGTNNTRREYISGFVAEEILDVAPELAYYDINGELQSYSNDGLIPHIVAELQRLMPMVEELYKAQNSDWVAPIARPDTRKTAERELYDKASAAQALIGDPNANPLDGKQHFEDDEEE